MKKTTMLKKNYEFKTVLTKGKCFKEKQIEIAKNMLKKGMDIELISEITKLPIEEIEKLNN